MTIQSKGTGNLVPLPKGIQGANLISKEAPPLSLFTIGSDVFTTHG